MLKQYYPNVVSHYAPFNFSAARRTLEISLEHAGLGLFSMHPKSSGALNIRYKYVDGYGGVYGHACTVPALVALSYQEARGCSFFLEGGTFSCTFSTTTNDSTVVNKNRPAFARFSSAFIIFTPVYTRLARDFSSSNRRENGPDDRRSGNSSFRYRRSSRVFFCRSYRDFPSSHDKEYKYRRHFFFFMDILSIFPFHLVSLYLKKLSSNSLNV